MSVEKVVQVSVFLIRWQQTRNPFFCDNGKEGEEALSNNSSLQKLALCGRGSSRGHFKLFAQQMTRKRPKMNGNCIMGAAHV